MTNRERRFTARAARACRPLLVLLLLAATAQAADARAFIWKVSRGAQSIYVVGSLHLLTEDFYPLNPAMEAAFKDSSLLVEEVDFGEMMSPDSQMSVLTRGMLPANQSLDQVISPKTLADVTKRLSEAGMPIEPLKRFKPWALALTLLGVEWQEAGFDPQIGLDKHFYDMAQASSMPVQGLETTAFQIAQFDDMPYSDQDKMLRETLKDLDTEQANLTRLANAWKAGDGAAVEKVMLRDLKTDPAMYRRLLVDRNRTWLPKLEALFSRQGHAFVVVGAAHVVGPDGLLAMFRANGYTVEQQ